MPSVLGILGIPPTLENTTMETSIVENTLTDGSKTYDVVAIDGSQRIVINATSEHGAQEIMDVLLVHASSVGVY